MTDPIYPLAKEAARRDYYRSRPIAWITDYTYVEPESLVWPDARPLADAAQSVVKSPETLLLGEVAVGKTILLAALSLWFADTNPDGRVEVFAHEARPFAKEMERLAHRGGAEGSFVDRHPDAVFLAQRIDGEGVSIGVRSYRRYEGEPGVASGFASPATLCVVDDAEEASPAFLRALRRSLTGVRDRLVMAEAIPPRRGVVVARAYDHPNVVSGEDVVPGAVTRELAGRYS